MVSLMLSGCNGAWFLDENTGTTPADSSGNGNNGAFGGTNPSWNPTGHNGAALTFATGYVNVGNAASLQLSVFTILAWIYPTASATGAIMGSASSNGIEFRWRSNGYLELLKQNAANMGGSNTTVAQSTWTHVAVTYDVSGNFGFFINGLSKGTGTNLQTFTHSNHWIGGAGNGEYFKGSLDEVQIYNRVLSSTEINSIYTYIPGQPYISRVQGVAGMRSW